MSDISPISRPSIAALNQNNTRAARPEAAAPSSAPARAADQAEFSTASRLLSRLSELPDVRSDLVNRVRAEIANGSYETDDKINAAIENLVEDL